MFEIDKPVISVFASGDSILEMPYEEIQEIKNHTYSISLNYGFQYIKPDMNIHSDIRVTEYIGKFFQTDIKTFKILSREEAFNRTVDQYKPLVDYWFKTHEFTRGNYTIIWLLGLLRHHFPNTKVLLFGVDFYISKNLKYYDTYTNYDKLKRGVGYKAQVKLDQCKVFMTKHTLSDNFINCNLKSGLDIYKKDNWRNYVNK